MSVRRHHLALLVLAAGGLPLAVVGLTGNEGTRTETTAVSATFNPQRGRTFEQPELPRLCGGLVEEQISPGWQASSWLTD
jgi:hypothetical protein